MKNFEVTLRGFDGGTDQTDHLVLWVWFDGTVDALRELLEPTGLVAPGGEVAAISTMDVVAEKDIDFALQAASVHDFAETVRRLVQITESGKALYRCECGFVGDIDNLSPIDDVEERVLPGELMASGCCPRCGELFEVENSDVPNYTLDVVAGIMKARGWTVEAPVADTAATG